jgi:chaperonin GroES
MNVVPVGDHVVVKRMEAESRTAGGIMLPDAVREKTQEGRVLAVGDGPRLKNGSRGNSQVNEGDRILFAQYAGTEVAIDGDTVLILAEDDILAIVD